MSDRPFQVVINHAGGMAAASGESLVGEIVAAFAAAGAQADVRLIDPREIANAVREAATARARLVVGGGDGTIGCVAQALADRPGSELALLPLGTLNHLARDLGIPPTIEEAAALAVHGRAVPVDVAVVNGQRFVNNASVGLYPFMVRRRDVMAAARQPEQLQHAAHRRRDARRRPDGVGRRRLLRPPAQLQLHLLT